MIKASDYIAQALVDAGISEVFMVVGGAAMHLNDSFGKHPDLRVTCFHHEQACAMAAESYFRLTGKLACVCVTSGPGALNAITGVHGAWTDSMGMLVLSGQVKRETINTDSNLRQLGDQEVDIVSMVRGITKYTVPVLTPAEIPFHLPRAIRMASTGRPGPTWLDIPVDMQGTEIDASLPISRIVEPEHRLSTGEAKMVCRRIIAAKRPVILAGSGIRIGHAVEEFQMLVDKLGIPVVTAFNAHDLLPDGHPFLCGRQGTIGDRAGNLAAQNADFLLILGSRMNIRSLGYNWKAFAPKAYKVMVDIDLAELQKRTLKIDHPIWEDVGFFIHKMLENVSPVGCPDWVSMCKRWQAKYPVVRPEYYESETLNPYVFIEQLFKRLREDDIIVCGNGSACVMTFQAAKIKDGQRLYSNSGSAAMGWALPAAIGAARGAMPGQRVICIDGDGSFQMNVQEMATIAHNDLNIKIFVLNNGGYHSIRQTQKRYFPDSPIGFSESTGVGFPSLEGLADAYGLGYTWYTPDRLKGLLAWRGPDLCEVEVDQNQPFSPKLMSRILPDGTMESPTLDNMWPWLSPEEQKENTP